MSDAPVDYRSSVGTLAYRLDGEILFRYEEDRVTASYLVPRDVERASVIEVQGGWGVWGISVMLRRPRDREAYAVGFGSTLWNRDEAEDLAERINRLVGEGE